MVKSKPSTTGASRVEPFDSFDGRHRGDNGMYQLDPDRAVELARQGLNGISALQNYIDENGLYGKPTVMDDSDFDAYVKKNKLKPIYRGMPDGETLTGVEKHENFMFDDKYYIGNGLYGDGQYFGDKTTAEKYAVTGYVDGSGAVIKAALKPGAKVVSYTKVKMELEERYPLYAMSENMVSAYARASGYDAVNAGGYVNVINRDALVVSSDIRRMKNYGYI